MATGDKKRAVMTDDINNSGSTYPVMPLKTIDSAPDASHTGNLISSAAVAKLASDVGIVETGSTASQAITKGQYVIWQGLLYTADANISAGSTLASTGGSKNLTAVSGGGLNDVKSAIDAVSNGVKMKYFTKTVSGGVTAGTGYALGTLIDLLGETGTVAGCSLRCAFSNSGYDRGSNLYYQANTRNIYYYCSLTTTNDVIVSGVVFWT